MNHVAKHQSHCKSVQAEGKMQMSLLLQTSSKPVTFDQKQSHS